MATRKPTFDELLQQSREQSFYNSLPKDKSFDELLAEYGNQTLDDDYYNKAISGLSNAYTTDAWNVSAMGRRFSLGAYVNPLDYWKQRGQAEVNAKTLQSRERELSLRGFDTAGLAEAGASYDEMLKAYVGMDVGRYRQFKDAGDYYRSLMGAGRQAETPEQPETPAGPYNRDYFDSQNQQEQMDALDEYMRRNQTETPPAANEYDTWRRSAFGGATDVYFGPTDFRTEEQKADERADDVRARRLQAQDDMVEPLAAYYQALQQDRSVGDRVWQQAVLHPDLREMPRPQPAGSALPKPKTSAGMDWVLGQRDDMQKQLDATARKGGQWGQGWYDLVGMDDAAIEKALQDESAKVDGGAGNKPLVANIKEYYTWNRAAGGKARLLEIEQELAQIDEEKRRFTELAPGKFGNTAADDANDAAIQMEVLTTRLQDPYLTDEQRQAVQAELEAARTDYLNQINQYAEFDNRRQALVQEQNVLQAVTSGNSRNEEGAELRANDPDFNARAMYKTDNNFDSLVSNGNIKDAEALDAAYIYQYLSGRGFNPVNVPDAAMETSSYIDLLDASKARVNPESYGLDYLTQYERQTFEYKYNTQGQQSAMEWLDGMSEILMYRRAVQNQKNWAEFTKSSGWAAAGATALTVPANIYKAVMTPFRAIHQLRGGSVWDPINDDVRFVSTVRDTAGKMAGELIDFNIPLIDKNAGELIYGVATSMADFYTAGYGIPAITGAQGLSMFILGSSAASDGMYNAAMSGKSPTESVFQGVLNGVVEGLTEQISWKHLQGLNTVGRKALAVELARRMTFQGITEGGEEAIADIANMAISTLMYGLESGDFGDLKKQVAFDASKNGETLTDEELTTRALLRFVQNTGASALAGSISGVAGGSLTLATKQGRADIVTENALAKLQYETQNGAEIPGVEAPVIAPAPGVSAEQQEIGNELVAIAMGVDPDLAEELKTEFQKPMNSTQLAEASGKVSQAILRAEQGMVEPAEQSARQPAQQPVRPTDPALTEHGMQAPVQAEVSAPYQPPVPATQNQVSAALAYQAQIDEAIARKEEAIRRRDAVVRSLGKVKQAVVQDQLAKWGQMDAEYTELQDLRQRISDLQAIQPADFYVPEVAQEVQAVEAEMDRLGIPREVVRPTDPALTEPAMQAPEKATPLEAPARPIDPALTEQGILPPQQPEAVKPLKTAPARPVDPALTERFNQLVEQRITPQIEALGKTETRTAGEERAEAAQGTFVPARVESVEIGEQTLEYRTLPVDETVYNEQREKNSDLDDGAYSLAFQTAYVAGLSGSRTLFEKSGVIQGLDAETAEAAYKAGQEAIKKGMALGPKAKPVPGLLAKGAGRVRMLADVAKMDASQKKMAAALSQFSRAMGLNVEIYMSKPNADGVFTEEQGSYNPQTGVFRFDINAGINTQAQSENAAIAAMTYALPRVMGHEFTHFLKTQSPELFQKYQESLLQKLVEKGVALDERIRSKLARSTHGALSMDVALEEVIADGSEMMLQDSTAFADVLKADQNLWQKFKKWLADFTKTMQAQLRRIGPGFAESAATMEVVNGVLKVADDLQQQYDAMLREAFKGRPAQAAAAATTQKAAPAVIAPAVKAEVAVQAESGQAEGVAYTADNTPINFRYRLVNPSDIITSHDAEFNENPAFPKELQPRNRGGRQALKDQVLTIARALNPARLGQSATVSDGAPIVGPDGYVEVGNGRVMALETARKIYPDSAKKYTAWLKHNAAKFGIDPASVTKNSILVRERIDEPGFDRASFTKKGNDATTMASSETETAVADAGKLTDAMLARAELSGGELNMSKSSWFISTILKNVIPQSEQNDFTDAKGYVSQAGERRIRNALFQRAYGDEKLTAQLTEDTTPEIRNVIKAMTNIAPRIAMMQKDVAEGRLSNLVPVKEIVQAYRAYRNLKMTGGDVVAYLKQYSMIEMDKDAAKVLVGMFEDNKNAPNRMTDILMSVLDAVQQMGDPNQVMLPGFTTDDATKAEVVRRGIAQAGGEARYSERDAAYLKAVEAGDMDTAQKMVDEAAKAAGYTKKVFHGTDAKFTVFDTDEESTEREVHAWSADYPDGTIFATTDKTGAGYYGQNVMPLYIKPENVKRFKAKDGMTAAQAIDDIYGYEVFNYPVIAVKDDKHTIYATLDNTLLKSADPVTYDDAGNPIPLSQRFNPDTADIRYSERDSEGRQLTPEQAEFFKDSKVRDAEGNLKPMYHGTARADRVGTVFDPARATSGPMAFFTDDKTIAGNYAKDKADTSLAIDPRYDSYETQFRAMKDGKYGRIDWPIQQAWISISPSDQKEIERKARMLTTDEETGDFVLEPGNRSGSGGMEYHLQYAKGNVILALIEEWLNSANLLNHEGDFLRVLELTGVTEALAKRGYKAPVYLDPDTRNEAVYEVYLNVTNPFNTANIDKAFADDLEIALETYRWSAADIQADMWDKRNVKPEEFIERLRKDAENNTTYAWTSIPDYVTDYLKSKGYDGILDRGGKYTDIGHTVAIPFSPSQIKSVTNLTPTSDPDIRYSERDPENALPSPRAILAGAFGNVAVTEAEKKRVEQYKRGADRYNRVEKALRGLEAERRKLYTQGGTAEQKADNRRGIEELKDQLNKADRVLLGLENSQPLRDLVAREREKAERTIREREKKRSAEYREKVRERSKAAADERIAKDKERREQKETRAKHRESILKVSKALAEWVTTPSGKKHVPEVLRGAIGEFLLSINEQSKRAAIGGADTAADRRFYDRLDALNKALQRVQKFQNDDAGQFVDDVYEGVSGFLDLPAEFTERLAEILTQVKGIIDSNPGEHVLALMDNEALAALDEAMTALKTAVGQMNGLIGNRFAQTADEIGKTTMEEMKALKSRLAKKGLVHRFMNWENILPVYAFDRFGKAGKAMMQNFIDGFHKMSKNAQAIVDFSEKTFKAKEARAWGKDVRTFVVDGNEIQMSAAHVMSVWALMNREQAVGHILGGGIRIADFKAGSKNYVDSGHVLTPLDVKAMLDTLSPRQIEVAKALQQFMSTTGSAWGNEVSMLRFGVKLFGEENYFPIQSVRENMDERMDSAEGNPLYRLLNLAMTKPLTKNANNQILVGNIFDVFAAHMSDMAQYNGLALPVLNAIKWYNYRESYKNRDGQKRVESVRGAIRNAHGDAGLNYIYRLMSDINGSRMTGGGEAFAMNSLRRFNRAAVAANFRVMLLQPTSIIRAHNVIDARYLTGGALRNMARLRSNIREMEQYSGIAGWKQMGFYDVNLSRSLQEMIKRDNSLLDRATEKTMALPQAMDRITWAAIWNGAKMQVAAQNPGMDRTSAEYFDKVRDLFDQAIYRTQVVDSMLTRSDFMRRPSGTAKAFSSFMSEPTMTYNILASQVHSFNDDIASGMSKGAAWKKNGRKITRTITTWALSAALVTMVEALSGAWRDDDEYDTFKEKFDKALRTNALDNFMPINLPIVSDLWEIAKRGAGQAFNLDLRAYESNNPFLASYELVADGVNAVAGYLDGSNKKITEYGAAYAALRALSSLTGHPFSGATREVVDLWNNTVGTMYPQYRVTRYEPTKAGGINKLFQGLVDGDAERVAELRATLERHGVDDKDVNEGLRRNIRAEINEGRLAPEEGMKRLVEWGGLVETSPTIKGWLADGLIDDEQAETLLKTYWKDDPKEIYRLMDKWENGTDTDGDGDIDYSVNDRFTQAVRTGIDLRAVIAEYLDPEKFGSTKSSLSTAITTTFKDEYVGATPAERSRLKGYLLNAYVLLGYNRYDMNKKIDGWLKKQAGD